jgi:dTDP-4-amino-4,6-dideoxygalactose transaminase
MDPLTEIARKHGLFVIEDACQAHGAEHKGRRAGSIGDVGCFSFYPGKNLGAYGEAGAITTNDAGLAEKMAMFRDHGQSKKYHHAMIGWNARMDGLQGAILNVKLKHLPSWNNARRKNAKIYNDLLYSIDGVITPHEKDYARHVYHVYAIRVQNRHRLLQSLAEADIHCGIHYPVPVHLQDAYNNLEITNGHLAVAERYADEFVSLPMFPELSYEQQVIVKDAIQNFLTT